MWRKEIKAFAEDINSIELRLKSRKKLTKDEILDAMTDYRPTTLGRKYFHNSYEVIQCDFINKPSRDLEEGRKIVYELQMAFLEMFSDNSKTVSSDSLIDTVLAKYTKLVYRP